MKKLFLFLFQFTLWCYPSESQIAIEWQKCYGGQDYDFGAESIIQTLDGGFAFIGTCQGNHISRYLWRYAGNHRRLSGCIGTIY